MNVDRIERAQRKSCHRCRRFGSPHRTWFAPLLLVLAGILPVAALPTAEAAESSRSYFDQTLDLDGNGLEDCLDQWLSGRASWSELREISAGDLAANKSADGDDFVDKAALAPGAWGQGQLRLLCFGAGKSELTTAVAKAAAAGQCRVIHDMDHFGGFAVVAVDAPALEIFLNNRHQGRFMLDRDGTPAMDTSRGLCGADQAHVGPWELGLDWSGTLAILDSGCDTAHGDLGDFSDDDIDGPAPAVGDASDWYDSVNGWPLFLGYKVVGWQDVTDDFPEAVGPWDYHHHGTALAGVAAGSGSVSDAYYGIAPAARLTVVKFYDFDNVWHAWAGDFLAACAWTLDNADVYRIRTVLMAVNWDVDAGISDAVNAFSAAGILPVAAMGNYGSTLAGPGFPAIVPAALSVGSVSDAGAIASYSGRGPVGGQTPDLVAPGGGWLLSAGRITTCDNDPQDDYSGRRGTSLAAAHVAGAVYLLADALRQSGLPLPDDAEDVRFYSNLLKATAANISEAETSDGLGIETLPAVTESDHHRGWGLLRVDAAAEALLLPLLPGQSQVDTIKIAWERPVAARRLVTTPNVHYLIEAIPQPGLDVALEILDPHWVSDPNTEDQIIRRDENGPGVSEFGYVTAAEDGWLISVVKRVSGSGLFTFRLREEDTFAEQGSVHQMPGLCTGAPSWGQISGTTGFSLVQTSMVNIDPVARSLNVVAPDGQSRPGWPRFVFPHASSIGGLSQPMVWNLDGEPGDEIVLGSDFGDVYFFTGDGNYQEINLAFNRALNTPVGILAADHSRQAVVLDETGVYRSWSHGPVLEAEVDLGISYPLQHAAGQLQEGVEEEIVVPFSDGRILALQYDGTVLPGWPVDLGVDLTTELILCDLNDDGFHEIIQPVLSGAGQLSLRVLDRLGQPGPGDGRVLVPQSGGSWLQISSPAIVGGYSSDDLRVVLAGVADNGLVGPQMNWSLGLAHLTPTGTGFTERIPGLTYTPLAQQSIMSLEGGVLPAPIGWDFKSGGGTEPAVFLSLGWRETLYGLTSMPGSVTGMFLWGEDDRPMAVRHPLGPGGRKSSAAADGGVAITPMANGLHCLMTVLDSEISFRPVLTGTSNELLWQGSRGNARNTGAYPLRSAVPVAPSSPEPDFRLGVFPNPGPGTFNFSFGQNKAHVTTRLDIYDLRGRRVRRLTANAGDKTLGWDGKDDWGRPLAAGTYLAAATRNKQTAVTRLVLTR